MLVATFAGFTLLFGLMVTVAARALGLHPDRALEGSVLSLLTLVAAALATRLAAKRAHG